MYDAPHLIKNVRNNLKTSGFSVGSQVVSWNHIGQFHEQDCKLPIRVAPKLTKVHLQLPGFTRMCVRLATQVLSHSVAKGICLISTLGALSPDAEATAEFCEMFNDLFDVFNSRTAKHNSRLGHAMHADSNHWQFLQKAENYIRQLVPAKDRRQPCLEGWLQNINGLRKLFEHLPSMTLRTYHLNQDCLENLFSQIRGRGGHRDHSESQQFRSAFRGVLVDALLMESQTSNCENDQDSRLFGLSELANCSDDSHDSHDISLNSSPEGDVPAHVSLSEHDYLCCYQSDEVDQTLQHQQQNVIDYIGGFIVNKLASKVCNSCHETIKLATEAQRQHQLIQLKTHSASKSKGLQFPSHVLSDVFQSAETTFNKHIDVYLRLTGLKTNLLKILLNKTSFVDCQCRSHFKVMRLFLNVRLFYCLKLCNRDLVDSSEKRKSRKYIKLAHS